MSKSQVPRTTQALSVFPVSSTIDRYQTTFDHDNLIAYAGPQDLHPDRSDDRRRYPHRSCRRVACRGDADRVAVRGDGPLDAVASRLLVNTWAAGAGPGSTDLVIDLDSTICEVHGNKQGAAYGYTKSLGYHPLLATRAGTGEILFSRMRKGSAGSSRGINRFVDELAGHPQACQSHRRQDGVRRFRVLVMATTTHL